MEEALLPPGSTAGKAKPFPVCSMFGLLAFGTPLLWHRQRGGKKRAPWLRSWPRSRSACRLREEAKVTE